MEEQKYSKTENVLYTTLGIAIIIGIFFYVKKPIYYLFTNKVDNIEVYSKEFENTSFSDANLLCPSLGEGWRLPTIKELESIDNIWKLKSFTDRTYLSYNVELDSIGHIDSVYTYKMTSGAGSLTGIFYSKIRLYHIDNSDVVFLPVRDVK